ncbi:non-ribosomal peptide synthetase [Coleofasciculus sp.]|uniref:non-ribosomal peptide synthetase n=1 Tax=Coleofasciculus sp. TaxID=3100458 RepID=UPI003A428902
MTSTQNFSDTTTHLSAQEKRLLLAQLLREKASSTKSYYPLSYGQKALWFLHQSAPKSSAYNTAFPVRIRSDVDVSALLSAFQKLIDRHPCLRTTFPMRDGEPVQEIHGYQQVCFEEIDASTWTEDELNQNVVEAYQRPFDLERGPVLRVNLFTRSQQDHVLLLTIHHIASDGWSLWMLLQELRLLYPAQKAGTQAALPPLAHKYTDYIHWQTKKLAGAQGGQLWDYWQHQLAGELPVLNLPTDRPRPPVQTDHGASHPFKLNEKLTQGLQELAQTEGATLYMTLLAAFQVLLHRYTNQEDILVGSPTTGRSQSEFAGIVGCFVNSVVLRGNLSGNPTFKQFLSKMRQTVLDAIAHQDYPFPLLVERLQPNRDPSRSPLFQTLFVLQKPQWRELAELITPSETVARVDWSGLDLEFFALPMQEGQFDLTLEMVEAKESLFGLFKYNTDLFDAATISRMLGHFQMLLEGIVAHPEQRLSDLPLLTPAERQTLLVAWNDTRQDYPKDTCIHQLFEAQVEQTPDAVAAVFEDQQLTYRDLNCRANQLAHYLEKLGVGPEVLVGICVERSLEMVVGLLGILKAGGAYVPLDPAYPKDRLSYMLSDAQVSVLLTQEKLVAQLPEHGALVVCLDTDWRVISQESEEKPVSGVNFDNLAYVIYTSGSTGKPKGAMNTHGGISNRLLWMQDAYRLTPDDRVLQKTPFSFDVSVWEFFWPLLTGARLVVAKPGGHQDSAYLVRLIAEQKITTLHFVPSMLQVFLEEQGLERCSSLRQVICSGEALPFELQERFFARLGCELHNLYGPTEAAIDVTFWQCQRENHRGIVPIGRPIANTQLYILDRHLQPVPIGIPGELHIGGAGLARGYLNRPDLTEQKFIPNPFSNKTGARLYKTGDLARYLPDGNIEYLGRIDHQVKIRGFRIELGEIEASLAQHPTVRETVVIVREEPCGNKRLVAYIVANQESVPTPSELRYFLKEQLPDYMLPSAFVILEALPLTPNGKVDRRALPTPNTFSITQAASFVSPRDSLEWQLAQIWSEVLSIHPVGVRDNFFDLGGHSLLAVRLMAKIQQQFGKNLPLGTLFQSATIEQLANILRQQTDSLSWSPLVTIQPGGSKPPFFCFPGAGGNVIYFHALARHLGTDQPFYGLQALGLDGESEPHTRIEEIAAYCMEALQTIQPQGPYVLGGHSSGGLVAFEMAQQLQKQGHEVALVAILDTEAPVPGRHPVSVDWDDAKWLTRIANVIERFLGKNLGISYDILRPLAPDEQLNYIGEQLKTIGLLPPEAGLKQVRGLVQVFKANYQASDSYVPQEVYPTRVAFFRASEVYSEDSVSNESSQIRQEPTWGWNQLAAEPVELHVVPGDHITMFAEPHVQVLAERLKFCLDTFSPRQF